jgi:TonB family protein
METRAVSYGAGELKHLEHRYMTVGMGLSVVIHLCVIVAYLFKGAIFLDRPRIPTTYPYTSYSGGGQIEMFPNVLQAGVSPIGRVGSHHVGGKYAIPVPVPIAPSNEDSLLFKSGDPVPGEGVGTNELPGDGGGAGYGGAVKVEEEPPPDFVPVQKEPVVIRRVEPVYPEIAISAGLEGRVWVRIWVDREGRAHKAEILKSTADIFNKAALAAAMQFTFVPAYMNEGPVPVWVLIPFTFRFK